MNYKSSDFMLAYKTQVDYTNCLESMLGTQLNKILFVQLK